MNKNKVIIISVVSLFVALALLGGYKLFDTVCYPLVKAEAEYYLCKKYNAGPEEFELVDHNQAHIYWEEYKIFFQKPVWIDFSFEYIYNDRHFFVNRENGEFYDDYQLEDIEKWCTEWLQENVDKRITGIKLNSGDITLYQKSMINDYNYVLQKEDTEEFINNYLTSSNEYVHFIYYYDNKIDIYTQQETDNEIKEKLRNITKAYNKCYVGNTSTSIVISEGKYESVQWIRFCDLAREN